MRTQSISGSASRSTPGATLRWTTMPMLGEKFGSVRIQRSAIATSTVAWPIHHAFRSSRGATSSTAGRARRAGGVARQPAARTPSKARCMLEVLIRHLDLQLGGAAHSDAAPANQDDVGSRPDRNHEGDALGHELHDLHAAAVEPHLVALDEVLAEDLDAFVRHRKTRRKIEDSRWSDQ